MPKENIHSPDTIKNEIEICLDRSPRMGREVQVAFYGGSFTGLPIWKQQELLGAVKPYITNGRVDGIRLSTRPDNINADTASFLQDHGVTIVEIGIQSMEEKVLNASNRGHSVKQSEQAVQYIQKSGLKTGVQLMIGLPAETTTGALKGARRLARLSPDFARLYPALIIKGSGLNNLYFQKKYKPISLNRAIALTAKIKSIFAEQKIKVIRIGLQPSNNLDKSLVAGPHHPALGEMVLARVLFRQVRKKLTITHLPEKIIINPLDRSIFYGQKKCSLTRLNTLGLLAQTEILFSKEQDRGSVAVIGA